MTRIVSVPPPRQPGRYAVALVCLGNICRSPTADVVLTRYLEDASIDGVSVESCGTGDWHRGEPMDHRSAEILREAGYDPDRHRARHFDATWFDHDLILVMDRSNRRDVLAELPADRRDRVRMFRSYDPEALDADIASGVGPDVPDPWYGGTAGFRDVLTMVERTARVIAAEVAVRS